VEGNVIWVCKYYDKGKQGLKVYDITQELPSAFLGHPDELIGNTENWDVRISNPGSISQDYTVLIEWIQNDKVIHSWTPEGGPKFTIKDNFDHHPDSGDIKKEIIDSII